MLVPLCDWGTTRWTGRALTRFSTRTTICSWRASVRRRGPAAALLARMPEGEAPARECLIVAAPPATINASAPADGPAGWPGNSLTGARPIPSRRRRGIGGRRTRRVHHRHGLRGRECQGRGSGRRPSTRRPPTRNKRTARTAPRRGPLSLGGQPTRYFGELLCRKPGTGALPTMVGGHDYRRVATRRHAALN
jgi:hypothetical protein